MIPDEPAIEDPDKQRGFRKATGLALYFGHFRLECQFAIKELCRDMAAPTEDSWGRLVRLVKYLIGKPRVVI